MRNTLDKVIDKVFKSLKYHTYETMPFFDPFQKSEIENILVGIQDLNFAFSGGYDAAERKKLVLCPYYSEITEEDYNIGFLQFDGNLKFDKLTHRDVLGAIMSLGIKRELLGDIIIDEEKGTVQCIVDLTIIDYIKFNLKQIKNVGINALEIEKEMLNAPAKKMKKIRSTVASLRLDAVSSLAYGISRNKASELIKKGALKHNWKVIVNPALGVKKGDMLSIKGKGRVEILDIEGKTKKGRVALVLGKYM